MSDASDPIVEPAPEAVVVPDAHEVEIDVAGFLPDDAEIVDAADLENEESTEAESAAATPPVPAAGGTVDVEALSQIERDLDAVDAAIAALDAGTYGIDPASGQPIDDALLAANPTRLS